MCYFHLASLVNLWIGCGPHTSASFILPRLHVGGGGCLCGEEDSSREDGGVEEEERPSAREEGQGQGEENAGVGQ